jgi:DNA-binding LacI/PurR family transcriptional regulator
MMSGKTKNGGVFGNGDKPTSFDIAALAGVSQPTVSRALRGDITVSSTTRMRVEAIARQLNYKVDKHASSLRRGQSMTLALLFFEDSLPDGSYINPFFLSMLSSILRACAARGYDLLTSFQQMSFDWQVEYEDRRKADGVILLGYGDYQAYKARLEALVAQGTHFVRWGSVDPDGLGTTLGSDNLAGGRIAGEHLVERGRRRVAFIGRADDHYPEFRDRYIGLCEVLHANGLPVDSHLQADALSIEQAGYEATQRLLARAIPFDAIFAASDLIALGAMRALTEANLHVPNDVSVIGFDGLPAAATTQPPLTTVAQDYPRAGEMLVDTLIHTIDGKEVGPAPLQPRLVVRAST